MEAAYTSLTSRLEGLGRQEHPTTYKVPKILRDVNAKAYTPQIVAIGPYHHGKEELKGMEGLKLRYLEHMLALKPMSLWLFTSKFAQMEKRIRDFYGEGTEHMDEAQFIEMLVLDGCFVYGFICGYAVDNTYYQVTARGILLDMLMLENQIPFFVLCELHNIMYTSLRDIFDRPAQLAWLMKRVLCNFIEIFPALELYTETRSPEDVIHILDLLHRNWCATSDHCLTRGLIAPATYCDSVIPSAAHLKASNVRFVKKNYRTGITALDIEFREDEGILLMPTLLISGFTETVMRNLIAFEQINPHLDVYRPVTRYAVLLDCLIDSEEDVQILSQNGMIENQMGSDKAVAQMVNNLSRSIFLGQFVYEDTFKSINAYQKRPWNRAMGKYHMVYFDSPWPYISFAAAVVLLLLTTAQTIFAALQHFKR